MIRTPSPESADDEPMTSVIATRLLAKCVVSLARDEPSVAAKLIERCLASSGDGSPSEAEVTAAITEASRRDTLAHRRKLALMTEAGVGLLFTMAAMLVLVYICRDQPDLLKTMFCGIGLIVSHGVIGVSCFLAGRSGGDAADHG